jgi:hypothetical protein
MCQPDVRGRLVTAHRSEWSSGIYGGLIAGLTVDSQPIPVGGTGRKIEEVSDVQVDLSSTSPILATVL